MKIFMDAGPYCSDCEDESAIAPSCMSPFDSFPNGCCTGKETFTGDRRDLDGVSSILNQKANRIVA